MDKAIALVEIGTNSAKLLIATPDGDGFRQRHFARHTTRMGRALAHTGEVDEPGLDGTVAAAQDFRRVAERHGCESVFAFATDALRRARNAQSVAAKIERALGVPLRVLTGREEAHYAYRSARHGLALRRPVASRHTMASRRSVPSRRAHTVLFDTGGGSTELVLGRGARVIAWRSLRLGALHETERFIAHDPPRRGELDSLVRYIDRVVGPALAKTSIDRLEPGDFDLVASGGGVTTILWMEGAGHLGGKTLTLGAVTRWLDRCAALPLAERRKIPGLEPDRAPIVVAGLAIVASLMRAMRKRALAVHTGGVREGVLLHIIERGFRW